MTIPNQTLAAAIAQVFRLEYAFATLPGMTITFFLCARTPRDFLSVPVIEGLLVVALMIYAGLGINAITDRDIDRKYATFKNRIPDAIDVIGLKRAWYIVLAQIAAACVLAAHISLQFMSWLPMILVVAEAMSGYGYSLRPLHFKVRGVIPHAVSLTLATGGIPFILSAYTYLGAVPPALAVFIVGFALVQYGFEFVNQALDYLEDKAENIRTPAVRLGVPGAIRAALIVPLAGMIIAFAGLYLLLLERRDGQALDVSRAALHLTWGLAVAAMLIGYATPMLNTWRMYRLCRREPPERCVPRLPELCNYAWWQASSVSGVAVATAIFYFATNHAWTSAR